MAMAALNEEETDINRHTIAHPGLTLVIINDIR